MKHLPPIDITVIPHKEQRYDTVGDYYKDGTQLIFTSKMSDHRYEFLVAIHELIEWYLTETRGIKEKDITRFDILFEKEREQGLHKIEDEPGFDERAPYIKEHNFATMIERLVAKELGVNWEEYDKEVNSL